MAVVTRKSTAIGNRDAIPTVPTLAAYDGGMVKEKSGYVLTVTGDSATSKYPMVSVPSNTRVSGIVLQCAAQGAGATINCGVYVPSTSNPALLALNSGYTAGAAINATFFASAVDVSGALSSTEIVNQSGSNTLDKQEQELWQALGLASDPGCMLDIALAVGVAIASGGLIGIKVKYVQ